METTKLDIAEDTGKVLIDKFHAKRLRLNVYWDSHGKRFFDDEHPSHTYSNVDFEVYKRSGKLYGREFVSYYINIPSKNIFALFDELREGKNGCWTCDAPWGAG